MDRNCIFKMRITDVEDVAIDTDADTRGMTRSDYGRLCFFGDRAQRTRRPKFPSANLAAARELNALGNNLNQLTRYFHAGEPDLQALHEALAAIRVAIEKLFVE
jgi:hypothetical protein